MTKKPLETTGRSDRNVGIAWHCEASIYAVRILEMTDNEIITGNH